MATIGEGHMFGELALVDDSQRSATIIATEDSYLMTFKKENFNFIKKYYQQEFTQRKEFLTKILP